MKKWITAALLVAAGMSVASAQTYPSHPITMIVPFAAGGPTDTLGRLLADRMKGTLDQNIVIENVTGAAGTIAGQRAARSPADGYTIIIGHWGTHVLNGVIYTLAYDVFDDFEPIALIATGPQLIVGRIDLPAQNLQELIAWLKKDSTVVSGGRAGAGSHVASVFFQQRTGTNFQLVPYRGAAPAVADLIAGHIDLVFDQASNALPHVRSGKVRAFAVTAKTRLAAAPDIPTVDEAGLPGLYVAYWHALWAPKGTPKLIIAKLNAAVVASLNEPTLRAKFIELGQELPTRGQLTPEALRAFHQAEIAKWSPVVKAANIKGE